MNEPENNWRPRRGQRVLVDGRTRGQVVLSDPEARLALVQVGMESVVQAWAHLSPDLRTVQEAA